MRICHIADIHFRGLTRHDEYKKVFIKLVDDIKDKNIDIIFIGGDLYHTKTSGLSPEYIEIITWWFDELSKIAPLHIILGNHDGNLSNMSRQDAVTPIINAMNSDKIFLYKKSGVYPLSHDYNLCVFSIFDEEGWVNVKPEINKINIACYHGSIKGAKTDEGWELESDIGIDFFYGYDFVLLGDIHAKQFLGYRDCEILVSQEELKKYRNYEIINE